MYLSIFVPVAREPFVVVVNFEAFFNNFIIICKKNKNNYAAFVENIRIQKVIKIYLSEFQCYKGGIKIDTNPL